MAAIFLIIFDRHAHFLGCAREHLIEREKVILLAASHIELREVLGVLGGFLQPDHRVMFGPGELCQVAKDEAKFMEAGSAGLILRMSKERTPERLAAATKRSG